MKGYLLETYDCIQDPYQTHAIKDHLKKPWQKIEENNAHYLKQGRKVGPDAEQFIRTVLQRGNGFVDTRIIWGFLSLNKKYPADRINQAAADALRAGRLSSRFVETLLKLEKKPMSTFPVTPKKNSNTVQSIQTHKFVRPMSVYTEQLDLFH